MVWISVSPMHFCWSLWEVIRSWRQSPHEWNSCPYERGLRETLTHSATWAPLATCGPGSGPSPCTEFASTLILDFSALELWEQIPVVYKLLRLRCYSSPNTLRHSPPHSQLSLLTDITSILKFVLILIHAFFVFFCMFMHRFIFILVYTFSHGIILYRSFCSPCPPTTYGFEVYPLTWVHLF